METVLNKKKFELLILQETVEAKRLTYLSSSVLSVSSCSSLESDSFFFPFFFFFFVLFAAGSLFFSQPASALTSAGLSFTSGSILTHVS